MAEENKDQAVNVIEGEGEVKDRDFHFFGKKEEAEEKKPQEVEVLSTGVEKIHIEEGHKAEEEKEKHGLHDKLHRSHSSSSSSSSDEEEEVEGEGGVKEKIKKKKTLKEKIDEKLHGGEKKEEEEKKEPTIVQATAAEDTSVVVEKVDLPEPPTHEEEKKGFLEKIKDKLPGHSKKASEESSAVPPPPAYEVSTEDLKEQEVVEGPEGKEKKGFLGKIIEKLPGYHKNAGEEADKSPASH